MRITFLSAICAALLALGAGCESQDHDHDAAHAENESGSGAHKNMWESVKKAVCAVYPTEGNDCRGTIRFEDTAEGVKVTADITGLKPNAKHGFHIHEWGDCTGPDGKTTGGHYNPEGHDHAGPAADKRHAGDMGNLEADGEGKARYEMTLKNMTVAGMKNPIIGRGVIIHAGEDDLKSQPTGAAGDRIGCGVIGIAKP